MKANSGTKPERIVKGHGTAHYNYNIQTVTVEDMDGVSRTAYDYNYVVIDGKVTKAKIIRALELSKLDIEEEIDPSGIESGYNAAKEGITLSGLSTLTYSELNTHINNNVTDLQSTKIFLKRLSKVVLALLKYHNVR